MENLRLHTLWKMIHYSKRKRNQGPLDVNIDVDFLADLLNRKEKRQQKTHYPLRSGAYKDQSCED